MLCRIDRKGKVHAASRECRMAHGVALAPNQQKLYVADTASANVRVYDISGDGSPKTAACLQKLDPTDSRRTRKAMSGLPTAMRSTVFDSRGTKLGSIAMPETPSNCAWGEGFRGLICDGEVLYL